MTILELNVGTNLPLHVETLSPADPRVGLQAGVITTAIGHPVGQRKFLPEAPACPFTLRKRSMQT